MYNFVCDKPIIVCNVSLQLPLDIPMLLSPIASMNDCCIMNIMNIVVGVVEKTASFLFEMGSNCHNDNCLISVRE